MTRAVSTSCTIEARVLDSGDVEVLLQKSTGGYRDSKLHRELFIMVDSPETRTFLEHLKRIGAAT